VVQAAAAALGANTDDPTIAKAAAAAGGSVVRAIAMAGGPMLVLREEVAKLLKALPALDAGALHALGDQLDRGDRSLFDLFVGAIRDWLSGRLDTLAHDPAGLARSAELWDRLNTSARDVAIYNLERKPMVFAIFGLLAEASRG
jgi:DNA polymerase-3 subunit delta'